MKKQIEEAEAKLLGLPQLLIIYTIPKYRNLS